MGFMGLSSWIESDFAADFRASLVNDILKSTKKELKNKANEFNTPGFINIAFMIEEGVYDFLDVEEVQENQEMFLEVYEELSNCDYWNEGTDLDIAVHRLTTATKKFLEKNEIKSKI